MFSFEKIIGADTALGPEMKSTGEVLGISQDYNEALLKAFEGGGISLPKDGKIIVTVRDKDKPEICEMLKAFKDSDFRFYATPGTRKALLEAGIPKRQARQQDLRRQPEYPRHAFGGGCVAHHQHPHPRGGCPTATALSLRRIAVESGASCLTSLDAARAIMQSAYIVPSDKMSLTGHRHAADQEVSKPHKMSTAPAPCGGRF